MQPDKPPNWVDDSRAVWKSLKVSWPGAGPWEKSPKSSVSCNCHPVLDGVPWEFACPDGIYPEPHCPGVRFDWLATLPPGLETVDYKDKKLWDKRRSLPKLCRSLPLNNFHLFVSGRIQQISMGKVWMLFTYFFKNNLQKKVHWHLGGGGEGRGGEGLGVRGSAKERDSRFKNSGGWHLWHIKVFIFMPSFYTIFNNYSMTARWIWDDR